MSSDVRNLDALRNLRVATLQLSDDFRDASMGFRAAVLRTEQWIQDQQPGYWKRQLQQAERELRSAETALHQLESQVGSATRVSATEAKQRVVRSRTRLDFCRSRVELCRKHSLRLSRLIDALAGPVAELQGRGDSQLPRAAADLQKWIDVLESYSGTSGNP